MTDRRVDPHPSEHKCTNPLIAQTGQDLVKAEAADPTQQEPDHWQMEQIEQSCKYLLLLLAILFLAA